MCIRDRYMGPPKGLCWDDSLYVDNSYDPYLNFSTACILAIKPYCWGKLQVNSDDGECFMFKRDCATATVFSASYGTSYSSFTIVTDQKLASGVLDNDIFSGEMSNATVKQLSETTILVNISGLPYPPSRFQFKPKALKTICDIYFSGSTFHSISMPTKTYETVKIFPPPSPINPCENITFTSTVTKPYPWPITYTWNAQYTTMPTPNALLHTAK
eukprot:TRINITY_DN29027_c0_g1_i2.p1 TRINITY_DN29027_c0_g1~~TRINITY_DN29027_c0_g1_i2.p1  ORF type:complete len:215 (+),score=8.74 TRINITY_DN29027_c0_g1_i2:127-771(+)